ncbi:hypothetical protein FT663_02544 [Candidozyma haemuli var. vulneris]|uniref:Uncharacterized protein n=1 Tax=Candidozyma haemuli TaxID=45357 RepID=A0A2V1AL80_9ASCO|nr:hypothetical protein CXQ85_001372 [[Candida] haemuloni]KAF3989718.1 hypothetical protein FT662_02693 [[Candida] haemuloni var. vulneris]KAF3991922.1 hypothetical protein FT663_02544 [[Candida] haemuloni var. vulneris]PVH19077.1 hypothetical protein CXQ85_001372 [[Candida] haemuloni]
MNRIPNNGEPGNDTSADERDVAVKRKSSTQKDKISILRQEQILEYKKKVTKEERRRRYALRHGDGSDDANHGQGTENPSEESDQSPRKKKRVSFELSNRSMQKVASDEDGNAKT